MHMQCACTSSHRPPLHCTVKLRQSAAEIPCKVSVPSPSTPLWHACTARTPRCFWQHPSGQDAPPGAVRQDMKSSTEGCVMGEQCPVLAQVGQDASKPFMTLFLVLQQAGHTMVPFSADCRAWNNPIMTRRRAGLLRLSISRAYLWRCPQCMAMNRSHCALRRGRSSFSASSAHVRARPYTHAPLAATPGTGSVSYRRFASIVSTSSRRHVCMS